MDDDRRPRACVLAPSPVVTVTVGPAQDCDADEVHNAALEWLLDAEPMVLNVNVPNVAIEELRGFRQACLAAFGAVEATAADVGKGYVKLASEDVGAEAEDGTDAAAVAEGFACFTPLEAVCEAVDVALGGLQTRFG